MKREDSDAEGGEAGAAGAGTRGNNPGDANGGTSTSGAGVGSKPEDLGQYAMREIHLRKQEDDGELVYMVIKNDGEEQNLVWLITLKNIFSKQLPNMPKEYIVRLVLNPNHHSMICLKNGQVIGGITYRPFWRQKMAEIAFCAVSASEQVKGYGTRLMNHLKEYVCEKENMTHLITFADNNAVGYFQKQGFTKDVMMEREKWVGYIKEYDGGTIMECALSAQVSYTDFPVMIRQQRKAVDEKVRELSSAHVVYPGLEHFKGEHGTGGYHKPISPDEIKGTERGWLGASWTAQVSARAPRVRRRDAHSREPASVHARAGESGAEPHRRVAVPRGDQSGRGAGLLRRDQGPDLHGAHQGARGGGVLRHPRDVRRRLPTHVQQLSVVQRPGHRLLQVRHQARGVLREQGAGGHQLESGARRSRG